MSNGLNWIKWCVWFLQVQQFCTNYVHATVQLHQRCDQVFNPTANKFHYVFNLRDLTSVFVGTLFCSPEVRIVKCSTNIVYSTVTGLVRYWLDRGSWHDCGCTRPSGSTETSWQTREISRRSTSLRPTSLRNTLRTPQMETFWTVRLSSAILPRALERPSMHQSQTGRYLTRNQIQHWQPPNLLWYYELFFKCGTIHY